MTAAPFAIRPHTDDVEGMPILRALPSAQFRSIGPFVFFDHMLATDFAPGQGMNINQHPHIGLSTLTYLFEGQVQHKDSLGSDQLVLPGDVSWMTAGRGVAHVERTPRALRESGSRLHGLQVWLALPQAEEGREPSYSHHPLASLPQSESLGVRIRLIAGSGFCLVSPVPVLSPTLYADIEMVAGSTLTLSPEHPQRALYLLEGEALLDDNPAPLRQLLVLPEGASPVLSACADCRAVLIGGEPLDGARRMNWNFVASDPALIDEARRRWAAGDWPTVPDERERIELPR
ncbi:redox-sensitive bicupin YhaK (pirin superfamily) [Pseudomonas citronellolis]|uniref:pirin family protein n=1 Tax=Pseudomonas citronellolis TaxID=53408 RepID=UPI00209F32ED|nr:pirin family protein [Pseudomonas citronellolis]MCP1640766.1 redox-sensitive bicupin YhaK (pirin superfamily) [Pseudomonas citronellolis]MCP1663686.1 redox-sensitive bicupin YhaK (pirin superfamily) [Pseudomonas citronellolis]MCP1696012.1 redox-sensitive bicupin YhaK (pirin superfamily) [Pseudomonas citronellolis]MCP1701503.1 redox-sensitive bicupin YhaK (pirin superfamily) [Pseudomonas citronellolis]MCP1795472.1 redox-sensitive bicupin YhaK (pirin superfamily) [Pseudomonas citronellolis]